MAFSREGKIDGAAAFAGTGAMSPSIECFNAAAARLGVEVPAVDDPRAGNEPIAYLRAHSRAYIKAWKHAHALSVVHAHDVMNRALEWHRASSAVRSRCSTAYELTSLAGDVSERLPALEAEVGRVEALGIALLLELPTVRPVDENMRGGVRHYTTTIPRASVSLRATLDDVKRRDADRAARAAS